MAAPEEIARAYQRQQKSIILAALAAILALWRRLNGDDLTGSWDAGVGLSIVDRMTQAQLAAAAAAPTYLEQLAQAQGIVSQASQLVPESLAGIASDGRPLMSLMYQPIILFKRLLTDGASEQEAMSRATAHMAMIAATQVADAGRGAVSVGMTATRQWVMHVRVVDLPACGRCIILAGRTYSWSTGFERHPNCDCTMMPWHEGDELPATPEQLFAQMSAEDQNRRFGKAGAEAIRLGADMGQVVNARRGMSTAGGRLVTSEGTTRRGVAGRRMGSRAGRRRPVRPMPEQILADANGDRDQAIRMLEEFGYLTPRPVSVPRQRRAEESASTSSPRLPESARPFHRNADGIADLVRAVGDGGSPAGTRRLGGASAMTELVTLADGTQVIRKRSRVGMEDLQDAAAEQLSSLVARQLGLRAPAVYRRDADDLYMEYVSDGVTAEESGAWGGDLDPRFARAAESDEGTIMGLLDVLVHNVDRNDGNWMLAGDDSLIPIDHGSSYGDFIADRPLTMEFLHGPFVDRFTGDTNPLTADDVAEVRRRMALLRPDFQHLDKETWFAHSMRVLDFLDSRATGTRNLIAGVR